MQSTLPAMVTALSVISQCSLLVVCCSGGTPRGGPGGKPGAKTCRSGGSDWRSWRRSLLAHRVPGPFVAGHVKQCADSRELRHYPPTLSRPQTRSPLARALSQGRRECRTPPVPRSCFAGHERLRWQPARAPSASARPRADAEVTERRCQRHHLRPIGEGSYPTRRDGVCAVVRPQ